MPEDDKTRLWQRASRAGTDGGEDPLRALRAALADVRAAPDDDEARRRLRAVAAEHGVWDQLAVLLAEEARVAARDDVAAALYAELADARETLDQPIEVIAAMEQVVRHAPDDGDAYDRLARLYHRAGAWPKAAEAFERVAELVRDDRGRAALRAAARLYRDHGHPERAVAAYRAIVARRASDREAWQALDELLEGLGRWRELAEVRGAMAASAAGVDKAALLRAQARALQAAGDPTGAAALIAESTGHAPEAVSGLIDYAEILAGAGRGREAAELLSTRIADAIGIGAPALDTAALRLRLATILEEDCKDRPAANAVVEKLLAAVPDYLPALEWLAARAARDPDPSVHAIALLRYADALPEGETRAAVTAEAGRRMRDAGDRHSAVRALAAAVAMAPDDAAATRDLAAARAAVAVDLAIARARSGATADAERELREVIAAHPLDVDAHLALAEILAGAGRHAECAEHLRATLAAAEGDDTIAPARRALLVHQYALAVAAEGDADAAHQLLYEAHRLDRKNLPITLALGTSCFARKLWREAGIHLGSLAEHPDAAAHAPAVAAGLVRAAQADTRALRPGAVEARLAAAARLDPGCAPAWHGLAEIATERNDLPGAAEYLEREANATTEPRDRLRLFEALGDLANDVLGDPARAERCWTTIAETGGAGVLDKLLAVQRKRGAGVERGRTCERLAAMRTDARARKELLEEAADAYAAGGEHDRARACIDPVIAAHPVDVDAVACASAVALAAGDHAAAATWLGRALTAWDAAGDRGDGDPRRAELWRRLGDARRARGDAPGARTAYDRAVGTAPESDAAHGARRGLVDLPGGGDQSVVQNLAALVAVDAEANDVLLWARRCANDADPAARPLFELAVALGAPFDREDEPAMTACAPRIMASDEVYASPIQAADRRALVDDDDPPPPLAAVLEALAEAAPLLWPPTKLALERAEILDAERVSSASPAAVAAMYPQIAKALGGPTTVVYATSTRGAPDVRIVASSPPIVVLGPRLMAVRARSTADISGPVSVGTDAALRFPLGRAVELAREHRVLAAAFGDSFPRLVDAIWHAFGRAAEPPADRAFADYVDHLRSKVPMILRRRLGDLLAPLDRAALDPAAYVAACNRAADRSGLLACGDVAVAIQLAGGPTAAPHLVRLGASPRYHAFRAAWWARR
jgi:tetratricopeptide (TPR) repeat protein